MDDNKKIKYIAIGKNYWRVKIKQGKYRYTKHFSFEKCGGKQQALDKAIEDRDRVLKERGMLQYLKFERAPNLLRTTISNDQPIIGVYKTFNYTKERTLKHRNTRKINSLFMPPMKKKQTKIVTNNTSNR